MEKRVAPNSAKSLRNCVTTIKNTIKITHLPKSSVKRSPRPGHMHELTHSRTITCYAPRRPRIPASRWTRTHARTLYSLRMQTRERAPSTAFHAWLSIARTLNRTELVATAGSIRFRDSHFFGESQSLQPAHLSPCHRVHLFRHFSLRPVHHFSLFLTCHLPVASLRAHLQSAMFDCHRRSAVDDDSTWFWSRKMRIFRKPKTDRSLIFTFL